jgi:hypothetical protein
MRFKAYCLAGLVAAFSSMAAFAATPYKRTLDVKKNNYLKEGVFTGGMAGKGTTLLAVHRMFSAKQELERVVIDLGDSQGKPNRNGIGYFQVSVDSTAKRVVLDIAQLKLSKVSEQQVQKAFRKSPYVESVEMTLDPEDAAGSLVLKLKKPMKVEVFQHLQKSGHIVVDIKA